MYSLSLISLIFLIPFRVFRDGWDALQEAGGCSLILRLYDDGELPRWARSGDPSDMTHGMYGIPVVTRGELVSHFENGTVEELLPRV